MAHQLNVVMDGRSVLDFKQALKMKASSIVKYKETISGMAKEDSLMIKSKNETAGEFLSQVDAVQLKMTEKARELNEKELFLRDYDSLVALQEKDLQETKKKIGKCSAEIEETRKTLAKMETELSVLTERRDGIVADFDEKKRQKEESAETISKIKQEYNDLSKRCSELEEKMAASVADFSPEQKSACAHQFAMQIFKYYALLKAMETNTSPATSTGSVEEEEEEQEEQEQEEEEKRPQPPKKKSRVIED
jgi:uncharacterized protein YoxC